MSEKTIFKRIIDGEIPCQKVYEDDRCLAFHDISPQAPTHVLVIPKKEIVSVETLDDSDAAMIGHLWLVIRNLARELGLAEPIVSRVRDLMQTCDDARYGATGTSMSELPAVATGVLDELVRAMKGQRLLS